ncbi:MAG: N-acetylmuramoyl-L-alanine amidase [Oscillibacter sp.]|nr:N-acetylmuramoyl-L-alanine amidase [Oscillibacter sp.]
MKITARTNTHNTTIAKGRDIAYIALHFTAGTTSRSGAAANTADWFKNPASGGSADFIVDDVNIVQYNPDIRNRYCWAVGGKKYAGSLGGALYGVVTNRNSISVEICSTSRTGKVVDANDPAWYFTDAVLDRAVELVRYLMKEYGIDADHVVRHYDVSGKWCPGIRGWNKESGSEEAWRSFKARLTVSAAQTVAASPVSKYSDIEKTVWDFLKDKGLSNYAVAGIVGNLYAESSIRPNNLQNSYERRLELSDEEYTAAVDSGEYQEFASDGAGYGLAQWTWWKRKEGLYNFAKETNRSVGDLTLQLEYLWRELQNDYPSVLNALSIASSVRDASNAFLFQFEKPADQSGAVQQKRAEFGQTYLDRYALPFMVRVTTEKLNIRKGPGTEHDKNGSVEMGEAFTIVEVRGDWGRLKSDAGWICLRYTQRV